MSESNSDPFNDTSAAEIEARAKNIAYRYFNLPLDGDPQTLIDIIVEELMGAAMTTNNTSAKQQSTCSICGDPAPRGACCGGYGYTKSERESRTNTDKQLAPERIWIDAAPHLIADATRHIYVEPPPPDFKNFNSVGYIRADLVSGDVGTSREPDGSSQATHELKTSTLTPDGAARPKII